MPIHAFVEECFNLCRSHSGNEASARFKIGPFVLSHSGIGQSSLPFFHLALAHLQIQSEQLPDFIVYTIDAEESGIFLPKPCWDWKEVDGFGVIKSFLSAGYYADYQFESDTFTLVDPDGKRALQWSKSVTKLPEWERSFPFRKILYHFTKNTSCVMLHAGAVGTETGGILLAGAGGSGKSSSTLACIGSGLKYAGDDFILLDVETRLVYSLYNVAKLDENGLRNFPFLESYLFNKEKMPEQKGQVFLWQHFPDELVLNFPLIKIVLPKFSGNLNTLVQKANSADSLRALAPSTMALLKAEPFYFAKLAEMVRLWPCYHLQTGTDLTQIPNQLKILLQTQ
ncbi:MAG: hypothetical protein K1X82_03115 [Bacteroidia bacterium]|nr:hypothetical protein [Bacteroidia bacterium]